MADPRFAAPPRRSPFGVDPPGDVQSRGAVVRVDGLPRSEAQRVGDDGAIDMLAVGPDAWLAVSELDPGEVRAAVAAAAGEEVACTDLTHARVVLRVTGPDARTRLARGCPMDLETVDPGTAAATMLGPFEVVIRRDREPDVFDVYVARSVARSAREWLRPSEPAGPSAT